jgi:cardiolipin synthase
MIGYLRLAGIPVFLYLAFESDDGRTAAATAVFAVVTAGDYVDGLVARATGQYSRMGALLDPVIDRLAILAGAAVCWHFELLPRWALAVLAAREVVTVGLAQMALRRGLDIEITWPGRVGVILVMSGLGLTLIFDHWVTEVIFMLGLVVATLATVLYAKSGLRAARG